MENWFTWQDIYGKLSYCDKNVKIADLLDDFFDYTVILNYMHEVFTEVCLSVLTTNERHYSI